MEPKKNPKSNVGRNSGLYFAVGLALMLAITYAAINFKTYEKKIVDIGQLILDGDDEEEIPVTQSLNTPPPPPPPPASPEVIEVVEDDVEIEETVMETTETDQEDEVVEVEDVEVEAVEEDVEVPFSIIENVPVFPGCEKKKNNNDRKRCMSQKVQKYIVKKFNTDLASDLGLTGIQRITVAFKIDKTGSIAGVRVRAPHPKLEAEAARVVKSLPKMKPGRQRGKPVTVPYVLPIRFQVE